MSRTTRLSVSVLCLGLFGGCTLPLQIDSASKDPSYQDKAGRTKANQIPIYRTTMPKRPYTELGVVVGYGGKPEELTKALREKAAAMGGDAIIQIESGGFGGMGTVIAYESE